MKPRIFKSDDETWECFVDGILFWGVGSTPKEAYDNWYPYRHLTNEDIAATIELDISHLARP